MIRLFFCALAVALACTAGRADDAITIKFAEAKVGDRVKIDDSTLMVGTSTFEVKGKEQSHADKTVKRLVYEEELLVAAGGAEKLSRKVSRTYERADFTKGDKTEEGAPLKTAILIEKKDGKTTITADGKPVTGRLESELNAALNDPDPLKSGGLFPKMPVKVGDSWRANLDKHLPKAMTVDREKGTSTGKLVRTEKRDGALYGVFEFTSELPITKLNGLPTLELKPTSKLTLNMTITTCIDGTSRDTRMTGKLKASLEGATNGLVAKMQFDGDSTMTITQLPRK